MKKQERVLAKQLSYFEENRFGAMTLMLTFQSCYGSIAAMYGIRIDSTIALSITAVVTMTSNAMFIAQSPAKWCVGAFYLSVFTNTIILLTTFFS